MIVGREAISSRGLMVPAFVVFMVVPAVLDSEGTPRVFPPSFPGRTVRSARLLGVPGGGLEAFLSYSPNSISSCVSGLAMSHAKFSSAAFMLANSQHFPSRAPSGVLSS
jgi:hypothetical protein